MRKINEAAQVAIEIGEALAEEDIHVQVITNDIGYMTVVYSDIGVSEFSLELIRDTLVKVTGMRWSFYIKSRSGNWIYPENSVILEFRSLEPLVS